ncbi:biotin-dependent carboxyltransferase family protein [Rhodopseudomonas palustris]|uniref:5-oxoprolinase subunit C family protein n=1 Tax=Rhodopseudomonas palustris TaxID=1076 RepID=UPI000E5C4698|nr:biotin-dependent carboxyltransferase family protein [Rhodopseudomonas palustris]QLH71717.1 biotin-dependent carboxyltransferase [Rhodopseudomonas palustris]RIA02950.1 biotin-dependent carboxyltransferase [Rhodopseudomonas palustris]
MTKLVIDAVGPATSVQDAGRHGAQRYGLPPSGAMDRLSLAAANVLVGNSAFAAAIELGPLGAKLSVRDGVVRLALTGAERPAALDGQPLAFNESFTLAEGQILTLGVARGGVFSYLGIEGGVGGEPMFGSLAVNARAGLGSPYPRPLQAGDAIAVKSAAPSVERRLDLPEQQDTPIRVVLGPQDDEFGAAVETFLTGEWTISATSDRMGYRLDGPQISHLHGHNIVSDGTVDGSIQVPGSGQPIVLMPDRGTSGGYPKIATVISADLGRLAQRQPGRPFRFQAVSVEEAQDAYRTMAKLIRSLPDLLRDAQHAIIDLDALLSANVAGTAIDALAAE